jgi:frataxin-like iron-binding protein CyaY
MAPVATRQSRFLNLMPSPVRYASTVRRRRGTSGHVQRNANEDEDRSKTQTEIQDLKVFQQEADKLLVKLERALRPMEKHNDIFIITHTPRNHYMDGSLTLELKPEDGTYRLEVNDESRRIHMTTALSGQFHYKYASTGEWADELDGHSLVGMLVRDLIRQCNGLPDL